MVGALVRAGEPFRARELEKRGIPAAWLRWVFDPKVVRVDRGVYAAQGLNCPRIVVAMVRVPRSIACLYSALWLHGLLINEPREAWLCIRNKAWRPRGVETPTQLVHTTLWPGLEDLVLTPEWNAPALGLARTVIDFFRLRRRVGRHAPEVVLEMVLQSGQVTLADIDACAERCGVRRWRAAPGHASSLARIEPTTLATSSSFAASACIVGAPEPERVPFLPSPWSKPEAKRPHLDDELEVEWWRDLLG